MLLLWAGEGLQKQGEGLEVRENSAECHLAKGELVNLGDETEFLLN